MSKPNRHTLAYLMLHLKRMTAKSYQTGLSKQNVAKLFGAVIVSDSSTFQKAMAATKYEQVKRAKMQQQIVLALLELPSESYKTALKDNRGNDLVVPPNLNQ